MYTPRATTRTPSPPSETYNIGLAPLETGRGSAWGSGRAWAPERIMRVGGSVPGRGVLPARVGAEPSTVGAPEARTVPVPPLSVEAAPRAAVGPSSIVAPPAWEASSPTTVGPSTSVSGWGGEDGGGSRSTRPSRAWAPETEVALFLRYSRRSTAKS